VAGVEGMTAATSVFARATQFGGDARLRFPGLVTPRERANWPEVAEYFSVRLAPHIATQMEPVPDGCPRQPTFSPVLLMGRRDRLLSTFPMSLKNRSASVTFVGWRRRSGGWLPANAAHILVPSQDLISPRW